MKNISRRMKTALERARSFLLEHNHDRVFAILLAAILPFVFSITQSEGMREPKAKFLCLAVGLFLSFKISFKISKALGISCFYMAIRYYTSETGFVYEDFLIFVASIYTCFLVIGCSDKNIRFTMKLLEVLGLIFLVYGSVQMLDMDPIQNYYSWADHRPVIFFGQHTLYAPVAATCFAAAVFQRHLIMSAILLIPAILIDSSFSYLCFWIVIIVFLVKQYHWKVIFAPILLALSLFVMKKVMYDSYRELYNDRGRFEIWDQAYTLSQNRPYFGYGASSFKQIYPNFQLPELRARNGIKEEQLSPNARAFMSRAQKLAEEAGIFYNPHSEYLDVLFEYGWVGMFFLVTVFSTFFLSFWVVRKSEEIWFCMAVFCVFAGNSIGNFPMHLIPQALFPLWAFVVMTTRRNWSIMEVYERTRNIRIIQNGANRIRYCFQYWKHHYARNRSRP